jgi:MFS family permease
VTIRVLAHCLAIAVATAAIVLATLLPFFPGGYDSLAAPVSGLARIFGIVGLLLVPIGAVWAAAGYSSWLAMRQRGIAIAALVASSVVWALMSLLAFVFSGFLLGLGFLAFWIYVITRVVPRLKLWKSEAPRSASPAAFYFLIVPVAVALLQMALVAPAIESSRNRAIRNSAQLIADIERYRTANGRYPESLESLWEDHYKPGLIGVEKYHYKPSGEAYDLFFEQIALNFGTREFVMYNPRDEQTMTSHKADRLVLTPQQLALEHTRGHYAVHDAPHPHWKYFWFD